MKFWRKILCEQIELVHTIEKSKVGLHGRQK